ncbi:MAG TPA: DUF5985 family protein [Polyangiaceae bacterium]|nr:DUF5985 family protein [Polyangiaceae bacterium]
MSELNPVIHGGLSIAAWVAGLFFLRFWALSRDRLFVYFCIAFWLLGLNWLGLAVIHWVPETRHQVFVLRLLAFVLIIVGVVEKNRRARTAVSAAKPKNKKAA